MEAAGIPRCCGSGVGWWLQLRLDPWPGNLHMPWERSKKWQKDKKKTPKPKIQTVQRAGYQPVPMLLSPTVDGYVFGGVLEYFLPMQISSCLNKDVLLHHPLVKNSMGVPAVV